MFQEIAEGLFLQASLLYQTQCVVTVDKWGVTCIDPGYFPHEIQAARDLFDARALRAGSGRTLALTHSDFDHIVGAPAFADAQVVTHASWDLVNEKRAREAIRRFDGEQYIERALTLSGPVRRDLEISAEGHELGTFLCYHADGHTRDGLVLFHSPTKTLIVGDYLSDCEFPFIYVSARRYAVTLEKFSALITALRPGILVSQHGRPAVGTAQILARLGEARAYMDALLHAAAAGGEPAAVAERTKGAWRNGVPDFLYARHLENARIARSELV